MTRSAGQSFTPPLRQRPWQDSFTIDPKLSPLTSHADRRGRSPTNLLRCPASQIYFLILPFVFLTVNVVHAQAVPPGFQGNQLTLQVFDPLTLEIGGPYSTTVGAGGVQFDLGASDVPGISVVPVVIDVTNSNIAFDFSNTGAYSFFLNNSFNGYVFTTPDSAPPIAGVSVDSAGTSGFAFTSLSATAHQIFVNVAGQSFNTMSTAKLDVTFAQQQPPPPTVAIYFDGHDITNTVQNVVVGQEIYLQARYPMPSGTTVISQAWSVPPITTGGFLASRDSGVSDQANFTHEVADFFWVNPGSGRQIVFSYVLSDGTAGFAKTAFNVDGPTGVTVKMSLGDAQIYIDSDGIKNLSFGNPDLVPLSGITFTAAGQRPVGDLGSFLWVQLISKDDLLYLGPSQGVLCTDESGLDTEYPYRGTLGNDESYDSPYQELLNGEDIAAREFAARMYLMWDPVLPIGCTPPVSPNGLTTCTSIPVPIGYVDWGFRADALSDRITHEKTKSGWTALGLATPAKPEFIPQLVFPAWQRYVSDNHGSKCYSF